MLAKPARRARTGRGHVSAARGAVPGVRSSDCEALRADAETRDAGSAEACEIAAVVGPGLASSVISAPARSRSAARRGRAAARPRRTAAATVSRRRGRRWPGAARAGRAPDPASWSRLAGRAPQRVDKCVDPDRGPRAALRVDDEVAVRTDAEAERDVDVERDRRPARHRVSPRPRRPVIPVPARRSRSRHRRLPAGRRQHVSVLASRLLQPARRAWPAWPVARKIAKRVIGVAHIAAPMPPVATTSQPPTRPIPSESSSMRPAAARRRRAAWPARRRWPGRRSPGTAASPRRGAGPG